MPLATKTLRKPAMYIINPTNVIQHQEFEGIYPFKRFFPKYFGIYKSNNYVIHFKLKLLLRKYNQSQPFPLFSAYGHKTMFKFTITQLNLCSENKHSQS